MIDAKELRIGNWVGVGNKHIKTYITNFSFYDIAINPEQVFPISITPNILEKAGFESVCNKPLYRKYLNNGDEIIWCDNHIAINHTGYSFQFEIKCKYVHQLQNIYFILIGEELNIEL